MKVTSITEFINILWPPLILTILFESAAAFSLQLRGFLNYARLALINAITNLSLNILITLFSIYISDSIISMWVMIGVLEIIIVIAEGFLIIKWITHPYFNPKNANGRFRPFLFSLIINAISFGCGLIIPVITGLLQRGE